MNKNLTSRWSEKIKGAFGGLFSSIKQFSDDYDLASMPAFGMFMVVITAGMIVNYYFLSLHTPWYVALAISALFEIGIGAWKFQGHRIKNSEAQSQVVGWAVWLSTIWAFAMLVSSLTGRWHWGWITALSAATHVIAFLLFDSNDDIRNNRRKNRAADERILQKDSEVDHAIKEAEADLKIIRKITQELRELKQKNSDLPNDELEFILEATRQRLMKEYNASANVNKATKGISDVNKDGVIGGKQYKGTNGYKPEVVRQFNSEVTTKDENHPS